MKDKTIRVVIADAAIAKHYDYKKSSKKLHEIQVMEHQESRMKGSDLKTDGPGRYEKSTQPNAGTYHEPTDPKDVEAQRFAHELTELLNKQAYQDEFHTLLFIAPGHFQSHVKTHAKDSLSHKIHFIDKDYTKIETLKLEKYIHELISDLKV